MAGSSVESNWKKILKEAKDLGCALGPGESEVQVVVASKFQPLERLRAVYHLGLHHFGENYLQEAEEKKAQLADLDIHWHFIGRIQSNKVKNIVGEFDLIHSVGREKILAAVQRRAEQLQIKQNILLQVNLFDEATKDGFTAEEAQKVLHQAPQYPNVQICGLMAFPPLTDREEVARKQFGQVRRLFDDLRQRPSGQKLRVLSMGTSGDYRAALQEGTTCLRLGEVLMGQRQGGNQ